MFVIMAICVACMHYQLLSHLLHILFAFVHFLVQFLLLVWCDRSLGLAVGLSGCSQLLLLAGHVVRFLSCLHLYVTAVVSILYNET